MNEASVGNSILDFVGNTPTVKLCRVVVPESGSVHLKLEMHSPTGAIEDRLAAPLLSEFEDLHGPASGRTLTIASMGNLAISLAMVCVPKGILLQVVMPDHSSLEKRQLLSAYNVPYRLCPMEKGFEGAVALARAWAQEQPHGFYWEVENSQVPLAVHENQTAQELLATVEANGGQIDAFTCVVDSGALFTAVGRKLRKIYPKVELIAVQPQRSPVLTQGSLVPHRISGASSRSNIPWFDSTLANHIVSVSDTAAWDMKLRLGKEEGLLVGISTGASVVAALEVAQRLGPNSRVYSMALDSGERYFSVAHQFP